VSSRGGTTGGPRVRRSVGALVGAAPWAFPLVLWFVATYFLLGDTGKWLDDWFYVQRTPETGEIRSLILDGRVHFWRPLYRVIVPALATVLAEHDRINHLIGAAAHGLNAWLVWSLMARLGVRRLPATLGALTFLVWQWHAQAVFWLCALPTLLSTGAMLGALHLGLAPWPGRRIWGLTALAAGITFGAACLNEQPAVLAGALPLVLLAGPRARARDIPRSLLPALAGGASLVLYSAMHRWMGGSTDIGGASGLLPLERWPDAGAKLWRWIYGYIGSNEWLARSLHLGVMAFAAHPARTVVVGLAGITSAVAWVAHMARRGHERRAAQTGGPATPLRLALLGGAMMAAPLVPIVAFDYWLHPRMLYASAAGLGVLLGAGLSALSELGKRPAEERRAARGAVAALGVFGLLVLAIAMVGFQAGMQRRHRLDMDALAQLRAAAGDAPSGSVFVPVWVGVPDGPSWGRRFDTFFSSVFNSWWSSRWALRQAFGRSDIVATETRWSHAGWRAPAADGAAVGQLRFAWDVLVPFELDEHNRVRLITSVGYTGPGGEELRVDVPITSALAARRDLPARHYTFGRE